MPSHSPSVPRLLGTENSDNINDHAVMSSLTAAVDARLPEAIDLRRELHASPRLSGDEADTRDMVLRRVPWAVPEAVALTGAVARLEGPNRGTVVFRAETDALPIHEETGVDWRSAVPGSMHACGHDVHMASAWLAFAALRDAGPGALAPALLLQPREESAPQGAADVIRDGILERLGARSVIGVHVQPELPVGAVSALPGMVNASWDDFTITVRGQGGHGAYPQTTKDPIPVMCSIVSALQQVVSRRTDPMRATVLTVGTIRGGSGANIVADSVTCSGTLRTSLEQDRTLVHSEIQSIVKAYTAGHGVDGDYTVDGGGPPLVNDDALSVRAEALLRDASFRVASPGFRSCGSDDFSFYTESLPSLMTFVGAGRERGGPGLHHSRFLPPDRLVRDCALAFIAGYIAANATL